MFVRSRLPIILCSGYGVLIGCASTDDQAKELSQPRPQQEVSVSPSSDRDATALSLAAIRLQNQIDTTLLRNKLFAKYEEDWRLKIEKVGAANYPEEARRLSGSLRLTVSIKSDGTVESVVIDRPSGHLMLDELATNIVRWANPFPAFPPELARDTDKLVITRTWFFGQQVNVNTR